MPSVLPKAQAVPSIKDFKESSEAISGLKCVYLDSETTCAIADDVSGKEEVFGIAIDTAVSAGIDIEIINYGQLDDPFFNFPVNNKLYLGSGGSITDTVPSGIFRTVIGKSLGIGSIFVNIEEPIQL